MTGELGFPVGLALGLLTLPTAVLVAVTVEGARDGAWGTHLDACTHDGPERGQARWRPVWRCPELRDGDAGPACHGLWVRGYVHAVVPNGLLWPSEVHAMREEQRDASARTAKLR